MITIPAPTLGVPREEWPDADFDLPDGEPLHTNSDKDDNNEDWDLEMDFGRTGGAKAKAVASLGVAAGSESLRKTTFTIRPPIVVDDDDEIDDDDEGVSTIKVAALPKHVLKPSVPTSIEEDMESAFALPSDLTQLSLNPLSLNHRSSKNSLEWGDKDHTSSSQSSDAYSTLGFADASPSSNSASSVSLTGSETDEDDEDEDGELDGIVIPSGLFESGHGARQLTKILESKKKAQITDNQIKVISPDPEDDFEKGLVIDDDDLSPSRLLLTAQRGVQRDFSRCNSMPLRPTSLRPPSRLKTERAKSPVHPPPSSIRQLNKIRLSPSPPLRPTHPIRSQTLQASSSVSPPLSAPSFLTPKPGSLRGQKSASVLKPPTPPSTQRKLARKASLSSLTEASQTQASGSGSSTRLSRYEAPTAASRAKLHVASTGRAHAMEYIVPPTRPSTPSSNPVALRLTMPTSSRLKSRPALSSVFVSPITPASHTPLTRSSPPLPSRPPSSLSGKTRLLQSVPQPPAAKVLRRPKRQRMYGDGTELDAFDDLPTDRDKEGRYRVQPKGYGNRVPGGSYPSKLDKNTLRKKNKRDISGGSVDSVTAAPLNTLKRTGRIEFPSKTPDLSVKRKKNVSSPQGHTRRKPTLIRNLGGSGAPKVVGDMKWNPHTLRWEGNDHILRDFEAAVGTSTRPALITHLTGSSIGSPVGPFASGARMVGNMIFDPTRMCWISTLPPEEDEPDVFANMADDEEDGDSWESKGGTIRACLQQQNPSSGVGRNSVALTVPEAPSPARSHTRTMSESGSDRGSRASMVYDVDDTFMESCRVAEQRHRVEMKGWKMRQADVFAEPDRSNLYEIRVLATRKY